MPGTQLVHALEAVLPVADRAVPLAHGAQLGWAVSVWYKPAAQGVHAAAPAAEDVPTGHAAHRVDDAAPVATAKRPPAHLTQLGPPGFDW